MSDTEQMPQNNIKDSGLPSIQRNRKFSLLRKFVKYFSLCLISLLILVLSSVMGGICYLNSESGSLLITEKVNTLCKDLPGGLQGKCRKIQCALPGRISLEELELRDRHGVFLTTDKFLFSVNFSNLPLSFEIADLSLVNSRLSALPDVTPVNDSNVQESSNQPVNLADSIKSIKDIFKNVPAWLPEFILKKCTVTHLTLSDKITPIPLEISCDLNAFLRRTGLSTNFNVTRHISENNNPNSSFSISISPELNISSSMNLTDMGFASLLPFSADSLRSDLKTEVSIADNDLSVAVNADSSILSADTEKKFVSFSSTISLPLADLSSLINHKYTNGSLEANTRISLPELPLPSYSLLLGGTEASWTIKGSLADFSSGLVIKNKHCSFNQFIAENTSCTVNIAKADIPSLLKAVEKFFQSLQNLSQFPSRPEEIESVAAQGKNNTNLLLSDITFSSNVNGKNILFETMVDLNERFSNNNISQTDTSNFSLSLNKLIFSAEQAKINASLSADVPFPLKKYEGNSYLAFLNLPKFKVDGDINIDVENWKTISQLLGIPISGSPFQAVLNLSSEKQDQLIWKAKESALHLSIPGKQIDLAGFSTEGKIEDLFGTPTINAEGVLANFVMPGLHIKDVGFNSKGNTKALSFKAKTNGDVKSNIDIDWSRGRIVLKKAAVSLSPSLLGLKHNNMTMGGSLQHPTVLMYSDNNFSLSRASVAFSPCGNLKLSGKLSENHLNCTAEISNVNLSKFKQLLPSLPEGLVTLKANCFGKPTSPDGNFILSLNNIKIDKLPSLNAELKGKMLSKGKRSLRVEANLHELTKKTLGLKKAVLHADIPFTKPASDISLPDMHGPINSLIQLEGDLQKISKLFPLSDQRIAGNIYADAKLNGTLTTPVLSFHSSVKDAAFSDVAQGVQLSGIQLTIDLDKFPFNAPAEEKIKVNFHAEDGRQGGIDLIGNIHPSSLLMDLTGKINNFAPLHREDLSVNLGGAFSITGALSSPNIAADLIVNRGNILLSKLPGGNIKTLEIYDPDKKQENKSDALGNINATITIPNRFFVKGYGLDCEWKGALHLKGSVTTPSVTGSLQAVRGSLDILTKNFKLSEGQIDFDGGWPISPLLNIALQYQASSIIANIAVSGTAANPKLTLTSDPALHQDEIVSQILFGEGAASLSHFQAVQLAAAVASLTNFGYGFDYLGTVGKKVGLDVLKFNSDNDGSKGKTSKSTLEAGTYVLDNVYVGIEQELGGKGETGSVVDIELKPGFHIDAKNIGKKLEFGAGWKINY